MSTEDMRWMCRERIDMDNAIKNGVAKHKKVCELVYGRWEEEKKHKNGQISPKRIVGEVYHELSGPTAEASISAYAEDLNFRNVPPSKAPSFKPASSKKQDPAQMSLLLIGADLAKAKPKK